MIYKNATQAWYLESATEGVGSAFLLEDANCLHQEQTEIMHIGIYTSATFGHIMTIDDLVMLTTRDNFLYHEMMTHPALYSHPCPKEVIIIGGGDCGTLKEVLKHPTVERVRQIDIEERVTRLSEQYFPELCSSNQDPRATLDFCDGIAWLANAPDASADVIIVDATDPVGPAEGLFQLPFFQDCRRVLRPNGLLVQQGESPFIHLPIIKAFHQAQRDAGFSQQHLLTFPQPCYPSGWWSATVAGNDTYRDLTPREADIAADQLVLDYYNAGIHRSALTLPNFIAAALKSI